MDLQVRSIHQATEPWVEESNVTKAKESENVQLQSQSDVDHFLWCEGNCSQSSYLKAKPSISTFTKTFCGVWCGQCVRKGQNCVMRNHGCFITTMPHHTMLWASRNSLPKITLLLWINLLTPLIWLPMTFLFPELKGAIKGRRFNDVEDIKNRDEGVLRHRGEIFPGVYGSMAEEDGKVR